jgi:hypothetical protein
MRVKCFEGFWQLTLFPQLFPVNVYLVEYPARIGGSVGVGSAVGDAFQTRGGLAVAGDRRRFFPWVSLATWDPGIALDSARRLADLPIRRLATAHGETLVDPGPRLRAAISRASLALEGKGR